MVIEKILKVNSSDPKVDELRKRLAALQGGNQPVQSTTPAAPGTPPAAPPQAKPDIAQLQQLSFEEQKRLAEKQNPELRLKEERTLHLITNQIKELITLSNEATKRIKDLESKNTQLEKSLEMFKEKHEELTQKMSSIDSRLEKFMGLYELITNQYNPFAQSPKVPPAIPPRTYPPMPAPVHQEAVVQIEDNLTKQTATVAVKPEDASLAEQQYRRVEELLADLQKKEKEIPAPNKQAEAPVPVVSEMHALLAGFESRLKQQFDQTLQEKLHHGFAALEHSLQAELRDALRAELEAVQKDDAEVQQALDELQALLQSAEAQNRGSIEAELATLTSDIGHLRDEVRTLPPNLYFRVADGTILKDVRDLRAALLSMHPATFSAHVGAGRNDFAMWVEHALQLPVAVALRQAASQQAMAAALDTYR
jgi:hypothetical protein